MMMLVMQRDLIDQRIPAQSGGRDENTLSHPDHQFRFKADHLTAYHSVPYMTLFVREPGPQGVV